jgi:extracellular factor (EF) 3-hydroxypalmitic acid methyl ester biosynthesis protein
MDHVLEWVLIHRNPDQIREIFSRSKFGKTPIKVVHEAAGVNLFAFGQKQ